MHIVIAAANSHLGRIVAKWLGQNHDLTLMSRRPMETTYTNVLWDGKSPGDWYRKIDGCDVVINLAGRSVNCRYTDKNRKQILESRVHSTRAIGKAIQTVDQSPATWLQMSTATIYSHRFDHPNDDVSGFIHGEKGDSISTPKQWSFSIDVAKRWEKEAVEFAPSETRLVLLRTAMVMTPNPGGVFEILLRLVRFGLGGRQGDGRQYVSWIHFLDFLRSIDWLIKNTQLSGSVNLCAPNPVQNMEFMKALRDAWGTRFGLGATKWMLIIGAMLMQTEVELILKSRRVIPTRLQKSGFEFEFPNWNQAAKDLCKRWRNRPSKKSNE